jgi:hypothetical protein
MNQVNWMGVKPAVQITIEPLFADEGMPDGTVAPASAVAKVVNRINERRIYLDSKLQANEDNAQNDVAEKINAGKVNVCIIRGDPSGEAHGIRFTDAATSPAVDRPAAAPKGKGKQK